MTREGALDFAGLEAAVGALAAALKARGLEQGDRVASWLPKNRMTSLLPLAAARAGLVHVPINPLLKRMQVAHILADSGAGAADQRRRRGSRRSRPATCRRLRGRWTRRQARPCSTIEDALAPSAADPDDLAALLYTSGSTGRPKGVMLSHANMWLGAVSVAHYLRLEPEDRVLAVLPLSFDYGQNQLLLDLGRRRLAWSRSTISPPRDVIRAVERHEISTLAGVPPLWVQLIEAPWPPEAALGAAPADQQRRQARRRR